MGNALCNNQKSNRRLVLKKGSGEMKNFKSIALLIGFFAINTVAAVDPGFEFVNKATQPVSIALVVNGQLTNATVPAGKKFSTSTPLADIIQFGIYEKQTDNVTLHPSSGSLMPQPTRIYTLNAPGKTKYITWNPAKSPNLYPQTGTLMGWSGKSDSGYSLKNNMSQSQIVVSNTPMSGNVVAQPVSQSPVFTPALRELTDSRSGSMTSDYPTSYSSTVGTIGQPVVKTQTASLGAMELGGGRLVQQGANLGATQLGRKRLSVQLPPAPPAPSALSSSINKFIDDSKRQGINANSMDDKWLVSAVGHILNGRLTKENKNDTQQKLFEIADAVVGVPLRNDMSISDDEYARITSKIENRIINFMNKLYVGGMYTI